MKAGSLTVQTGYVVDFEPEYPVYCSRRGGGSLVSHQAAEAALPGLIRDIFHDDLVGAAGGVLCTFVKPEPVIQCLPVVPVPFRYKSYNYNWHGLISEPCTGDECSNSSSSRSSETR